MAPTNRQSEAYRLVAVVLALILTSRCATGPSPVASSLRGANELLEAGKDEEAMARYQRMIDLHPNDPLTPAALNNLGVALERLGRFSDAESAYRRLVRDFPQSHLAPAAAFRVAVNAERSFRYEVAVWQYEQLVTHFPEAPDAPLAAFNRARLLEALQSPAAARAYRDYVSRWPDGDDAETCVRRAEWLEGGRPAPVAPSSEDARDDDPPPAPPDRPGDYQQPAVLHG